MPKSRATISRPRRAHRGFVVGAGEFLFSVAVIFECARRQHGRDQRREQQGITRGSEPSLLAGHSVGEYAALVATGRVIVHASALDPNNRKNGDAERDSHRRMWPRQSARGHGQTHRVRLDRLVSGGQGEL